MKVPFTTGRLHVSVAKELWFNTLKRGSKKTYLLSLGYYDHDLDDCEGRVLSLIILFVAVRFVVTHRKKTPT
jgi:hypothetical protein